MIKIGFVGAYDKTDIILYIAKIISLIGKKVLVIDSTEAINIYGMKEANKNYFVTSFDLYSLKRGIEILDGLNETVKLKKVLFSKYASSEEDDYLNFLSLGHKIVWESERIYFPFELGDQSVIIENQIISKIKVKRLSNQFRESLLYMAEEIVAPEDKGKVKKAFKQLEKEV